MAHSEHFTNDEIKGRIRNIWSDFVLGVDPDRLSDWLVQENVISPEQWQKIHSENVTRQSRCRELLHHLFSIPHPKAFLVVYEALVKDDHYLIHSINKQEPGSGISSQHDIQVVLQASIPLKPTERFTLFIFWIVSWVKRVFAFALKDTEEEIVVDRDFSDIQDLENTVKFNSDQFDRIKHLASIYRVQLEVDFSLNRIRVRGRSSVTGLAIVHIHKLILEAHKNEITTREEERNLVAM